MRSSSRQRFPDVNGMHKVSLAEEADIPRLCELLGLLFSQEEDFEPDAVKQSAALLQILRRPEVGSILVLREGSVILGMVSLLYTISTASGGHAAMLEDMVVQPERRGEGLGTELLLAAVAFARENGCLRITLLSDHANEAAICFYQKYGFRRSAMLPLRMMLE